MNKTYKKIICLLLLMCLVPLIKVSAYIPKDLSEYAKEISEAKKWALDGQVSLTKQEITTMYNGDRLKPTWNNHTVQWLTVGSESAVQAVVWSLGTTNDWQAKNVIDTAKDWESKHPGYIVVGGINGDFFDIGDTKKGIPATHEPTNFHVQEGDVLRAQAPNASYRGVLSFTSDNKITKAVFGQQRSQYMAVKVLNGKEVVSKFDIKATDVLPNGEDVLLYTEHLNTSALGASVDLSGYTVYEGTYNMYRYYQQGRFIKGVINGVTDITSLDSVTDSKFYIACKNQTLNPGDNIKIEYDVVGELAGAQNVVGFIYQVLKNSKPQYAGEKEEFMSYNHPRTLVGFKKDGSMVLMVVDGRGTPSQNLEGATLFQAGELLRVAGCVEGFNLDGGGSSTLVARINGELTLINDPSDARQTGQPWGEMRGNGNAVLLVMKDPKMEVEQAKGNTITIKKTGDVIDGTLQNVKVYLDGKGQDLVGDAITFDNLLPNMEYNINYSYEILNNDGTVIKGKSSTFVIKTEDFVYPTLRTFEEKSKEDGVLTLNYKIKDETDCIKKIYIKYGNKQIDLEELSGKAVIMDIDTKNKNTFTLIVELENGQILELESLTYDANTIPEAPNTGNIEEPVIDEGGCKKDLSFMMISLISLASAALIIKKRDNYD